jgi:hypothetical protein
MYVMLKVNIKNKYKYKKKERENMAEETTQNVQTEETISTEKTVEGKLSEINQWMPEADVDNVISNLNVKPEDMAQVIKLQRSENGAKRLKIKELAKENEKIKEQMKELKSRYTETSKVLTEAEEKKKAEAMEKAGEIEKVTMQMKELAEAKERFESQTKEQFALIEQLKANNALLERKTQIDSLTVKANVQWSSDWERRGFINQFSEFKDGEFVSDDEDIENAIKELKRVKFVPPSTPGIGPKEKQTQVPAEVEINNILEKSKKGVLLTSEELAKLDQFQRNLTG